MIFADIGAYDGDSVEQFVNWGQLIGDIHDCTIYAFDPNPRFETEWGDIHKRHIKHVRDIIFERKAAWVDDKGVEFTLRPPGRPLGSTVMKEKRDWGQGEVLKVESFDFSTWLKQFKGEDIYVKIDCEGAEFPILEKMIKDGTDKLCKLLFIEFHGDKMGQEFKDKEQWILENLNCEVLEWR